MSIETLLQENTAALRSLEAAIRSIVVVTPPAEAYEQPGPQAEPAEPAELTADPVKEAKAKAKKSAPVVAEPIATPQESAQPGAQPSTPQPVECDTAPAASLDYEADIKPAVLKLVQTKSRDAAIGLFKEFGVENAKGLTADQWPAFMARVNELLG